MNLRTGRFDYVSPVVAAVTGFSDAEMYAMPYGEWLDRVHPEDTHALMDGIRRIAAGGRTLITYRFLCKHGEYRWIFDCQDVTSDADGSPRFGVGFLRKRNGAKLRNPRPLGSRVP